MSRRGVALLLIGVGVGLILAAVIAVVYFVWKYGSFLIGFHFRPGSVLLALPFVLILVGVFLLRSKHEQA